MTATKEAPGYPGIEPHWTSSSKSGIGTAVSGDSNVWFTISHGIINEVYFPRIDVANTRDLGLIVTDGKSFFSEEKRDCDHFYETIAPGIPVHRLVNRCKEGRYEIRKTIIADSRRNTLIQQTTFTALQGNIEDYRLYVLLAPHLENAGAGNNGWTGNYKGTPMLFAGKRWITLACASSEPFCNMTCGYVGENDAWHDLVRNKHLTKVYSRVDNGNICLCGEINLKNCGGCFNLVLGFGFRPEGAGLQTRASLFRNFNMALDDYADGWRDLQGRCIDLSVVDCEGGKLYRNSIAVLKTHEGKHFSGSVIASLSIPWGFSKGDSDLGGYHLIWPRDQVQTAQAFLAAGDHLSARQALLFLMCTQEEDGHWMQCLWEDGSPYWDGLQMDECSLPILLADHLHKLKYLEGLDPWPMVRKAASFIVRNGPITGQDRWEENGGYTPYTIAVEISALLAAADFFDREGEIASADYLRQTADWWYESIDRWLYVTGAPLAKRHQVDGYYVRITPQEYRKGTKEAQTITIKNRPQEFSKHLYYDIVSIDALSLVRYGLRKADDPRINNTVKVIDAMLKTETKKGPAWHRYNEDGYGEHKDGSPYDGTGIGRAWPLLCGERAHYELAKGSRDLAIKLLETYENFAGEGGLIPEQIWDSPDIPEHTLYNGHSTGSAKPLVWAHAEYITLLRSLRDGRIFNMPEQTEKRYLKKKTKVKMAIWSEGEDFDSIPRGMSLRIQLREHAKVRITFDNWKSHQDWETQTNQLGVFYLDIPASKFSKGGKLEFTMFYPGSNRWEGKNYTVSAMHGRRA